jgi:hypothetical protein
MIASLLLALLVTFSGTIATYYYDENASFGARLCAGACLGLAALGLICFVVSSIIGLTGVAVVISAAICCSPLAILREEKFYKRFQQDLDVSFGGCLPIRVRSPLATPSFMWRSL